MDDVRHAAAALDRSADRSVDAAAALSALLARNWWAIALRAVVAIVFGILALVATGITISALVLAFAVYMLADGVLAIIAAVRMARRHESWMMLVGEAVIDLIAGVIALLMPLATVIGFVFLAAIWAIVSGIALTGAAIRLHPVRGRWLMALAGVVSIVWGVLLILRPLLGALVLTWWLGGYALVFGVALLALAVRLRRHHNDPTITTRYARAG